jgi:hypothetical protein
MTTNMSLLTLAQREDLRIATLGYLAARHPAAFVPAAIRLHLRNRQFVDFDFTPEDVGSVVLFLKDKGHVQPIETGMGASQAWQASASGILEAEKRGWLLP